MWAILDYSKSAVGTACTRLDACLQVDREAGTIARLTREVAWSDAEIELVTFGLGNRRLGGTLQIEGCAIQVVADPAAH